MPNPTPVWPRLVVIHPATGGNANLRDVDDAAECDVDPHPGAGLPRHGVQVRVLQVAAHDHEIAAVLTHIRSSWGNAAAPIDAEAVAAARARLADRKQPFSGGDELATLP